MFFGFSAAVNLRSHKTAAVMQAVRTDRILIESDSATVLGAAAQLERMCVFIAEARGSTSQRVAQNSFHNMEAFLQELHQPFDGTTLSN